MNDTKLRSVRIPLKTDARLIAQAEAVDRPVSWVIVKALEAYCNVEPPQVSSRSAPPERRPGSTLKYSSDVMAERQARLERERGN